MLWKCCHEPDSLRSKGWGVRQPYITSRAVAALIRATTVERRQRGCLAEDSRAAVTLGRRAAAWFSRSTTDCSAFPTSSDIATFHIPSNESTMTQNVRYVSAMTTIGFQNKSPTEKEARPKYSALYCFIIPVLQNDWKLERCRCALLPFPHIHQLKIFSHTSLPTSSLAQNSWTNKVQN